MSASPIMHLIPVDDLVAHTIPTEQAHLEHLGESTWAAVRVVPRGPQVDCICGPTYKVCRTCSPTHGCVKHHALDDREKHGTPDLGHDPRSTP